ncbi:MAG: tryptophan-rich sensory protein [Alphaproteobacteria bacterium]|nr:tryptophan-rich sensory protein [Alphaproteobacteria bacterium]
MFEKPFYNFLYSLFVVLITAAFCSYFNGAAMNGFYPQIKVSEFTPPNIYFSVVWGVLYILLVLAFDLVLNSEKKQLVRPAATIFILNMFLQVLWCFVFFYNAQFLAGFTVLVILDVITLMMIYMFYRIRKLAGLMLIPYFLWLMFATFLNWAVVELNGTAFIM